MLGFGASVGALRQRARGWRIRSRKTVETTKLTASATIAYGAVIAAMSAAGHARAGDLRDRDGELELRVAVDQMVAVDELGEIRLVRDVEEDGEDADDELDDEQLPDRERVRAQ